MQERFFRKGLSMRYVFAFILPPLGIALCGRWGHLMFNLLIWLVSLPLILFMGVGLIGWLLCTIHALAICRMSSLDKRVNRMVAAIQGQGARAPLPQNQS
jgi:uncharacterized membrane protein YqaE (UPF0057 family)